MSVGRRIRLCIACTSAFVVGAVPALAAVASEGRTVHVRVHDLAGTVVPDAVVTVRNLQGEMTVAFPIADGVYEAGQVGPKTTIDVEHATLGAGSADLGLPPGDPVLVDVGLDAGAIVASVVGAGPGNVLSAAAPGQAVTGGCPGDGDCCVEGGNGTPGCNDADCCNLICGIDPFCCDVSWDGICADEAQDMCAICAGGGGPCPGDGDCCAANGTPGCNDEDCCNIVCGIDPFCCDVEWDSLCADEAADLCGDLCGGGGGGGCDPPLECPPGALDEGEACGSDTNGGCNSDPPVFTDAACGDTFCGTAWADGGTRDTDWYLVTIETAGTISATLTSAFDGVAFIVDGIDTCSPVVVGDIGCSSDCANIQVASADLDPGTYAVFVATGDCAGGGIFEGFPCGGGNNDYVVEIACELDEPEAACCLADGTCVNTTEADCAAQGGEFFPDESCTGEFVFTLEDCTNPFEDISGTGTLAPNASSQDDGGDAGIPLGFTFNFFGDDHTTVGIASNGYLTFGTDLSDFTNDPIPSTEDPNDYIGPLWDDWSPNQAGDVHYQTLGAAGSQQFIAQWTNVPHFNTGGASTFQVVLFEGSNCIEYRYGSPLSYVDPTIGVENQDGTVGFPGGVGPVVGSGDCLRLCPEDIGGFECPAVGIEGSLDIKPGSCPNPFNGNSNGVLPVALAGTMDIDAGMVDIGSLELSRADGMGGAVSPIDGPPGPHTVIADVATPFDGELCDCHELEGDGIDDVSMKFSSSEVTDVLMLGDLPAGSTVELCVTGTLVDGTPFVACDCVVLVPPGSAPGMMTVGSNLPGVWVNTSPLDDQLDGGGFTGFYRTFPDATPVSLSAPVVPSNYPDHVLVSWTVDGVEIPVDVDPSVGKATLDILVDGYVHSVSMTYRRQGGGFGLPGGGIQQGGAGVQSD